MAKKREDANTNNGKEIDQSIPEGFADVGFGEIHGFFMRELGNTAQGTLKGHFVNKKSKFGPKKVYLIELTQSGTKVESKDGEHIAGRGEMIAIDESGWLKTLGNVEQGKEVFLRVIEKGPDRQDPWKFKVAVRT